MSENTLPAGFGDLERFMDWSLATERERMVKREQTPIPETSAFHAALLARMEAIVEYLNQYPYAELPPDAQRLCNMALSMVEVASLVEIYKDPANLFTVDADRFVPHEPALAHKLNSTRTTA
jgi:hypothetical protein